RGSKFFGSEGRLNRSSAALATQVRTQTTPRILLMPQTPAPVAALQGRSSQASAGRAGRAPRDSNARLRAAAVRREGYPTRAAVLPRPGQAIQDWLRKEYTPGREHGTARWRWRAGAARCGRAR